MKDQDAKGVKEIVDAILVTAADGEDVAVRNVKAVRLEDWRQVDLEGKVCWPAEIAVFQTDDGGRMKVMLLKTPGMGMTETQARLSAAMP